METGARTGFKPQQVVTFFEWIYMCYYTVWTSLSKSKAGGTYSKLRTCQSWNLTADVQIPNTASETLEIRRYS